ncbi:helix-turn-helix domain-containing protein [Oceanicaulis sp.]|uniref:helix-turn-helix domain-containing protein n=1 Tax=Oceanicaulis sp. TaxID=1924941 RepID=UPI003F72DBDC
MALSDQTIAKALEKTGGNMAAAAQSLKVTRQAVSKRVNATPELKAICTTAEETLVDAAEYGLSKAVRKERAWAIRLVLTTKGRGRGYVTRQEATGPDGGPQRHAHSLDVEQIDAMLREANDEELAVLERLLSRAVPKPAGDPSPSEDGEGSPGEGGGAETD